VGAGGGVGLLTGGGFHVGGRAGEVNGSLGSLGKKKKVGSDGAATSGYSKSSLQDRTASVDWGGRTEKKKKKTE